MRWNLLKTYDKIYTIDLHGNSKKKEKNTDGSSDNNVFDIMQGVSINIFVKTGRKKTNQLGKVYHFDLFGKRDFKYDFLNEHSLRNIDFKELPNVEPDYFFIPKNYENKFAYDSGFKIDELFILNSVGIVTAKDKILVNTKKNELLKNIENFYKIKPDVNFIKKIAYRPFDERYIYYDPEKIERPREKIMKNFISSENIGLALCKQFKTGNNYYHAFVSDKIIESALVSNRTSEITSIFPLYTLNTKKQIEFENYSIQKANFKLEVIRKIEQHSGLTFKEQKSEENLIEFTPIDLLDYLYAILYSPAYRNKYTEFLRCDFPIIPYPKNANIFWNLSRIGKEIRELHLLKSKVTSNYVPTYPIDGDNKIIKIERKDNRVMINETQYFDNIPDDIWMFYIGGFQPAQRWLFDRLNKVALEYDDISNYLKIIVSIGETIKKVDEIDKTEFL